MLLNFFTRGSGVHLAWAYSGLLVFLGHQAFSAYLAWAINAWMERFYDLVQTTVEVGSGDTDHRKEMRERIYDTLWEFAIIVAPAVAVHPIAGLIRNWWVFTWRRMLMTSYLNRWNTSVPAIEGASQRVHEDTQRFASGLQSCVAVVIKSVFTLAVFCPVLYSLDPQLMAIAVAAAMGGLCVSVVVGWPLVGLEVNNQVVEAELRTKLVILETDPSSIFSVGTPFTPFIRTFHSLTMNYRNLYLSFAALSTWLSLYEQIAVLLPYVMVAPRLFADRPEDVFTLGKLVKVSNAFGRVFDSLNVVSDRWLEINEWRSCLRRLRQFQRDVYSHSPGRASQLTTTSEISLQLEEEDVLPAHRERDARPPTPFEPRNTNWSIHPTWVDEL